MPKITVIYTDDTKPRRYVSAISRRDGVTDTKLLAELTADVNQAHDFGTSSNAAAIINRLHNPFDRKYSSAKAEVTRERIAAGFSNLN